MLTKRIEGSLEKNGLYKMLETLANEKSTGWLSIATKNFEMGNIYIRNGIIIHADIINRKRRIGDILVAEGFISKEDVQKAITIQKKRHKYVPLGVILLEMGVILAPEISEFLIQQVEDTLYELLLWDDGYFNFVPHQQPRHSDNLASLDISDTLEKMKELVERWQKVRKTLPSKNIILKRTLAYEDSTTILTDRGIALLDLTDGTRTLEEIIELSGLSEIKTAEILCQLVKIGIVQILDEIELSVSISSRISDELSQFFQAGNYDRIIEKMNIMLQSTPDTIEAYFYRSLAYCHKSEYKKAINDLHTLQAKGIENPNIFINLALCLELDNQHNEAKTILKRLISMHPNSLAGHLALGRYYYQEDNYDNAIEQFEKTLQLVPHLPIAIFYLGLIYQKKELYYEAIKCYQNAIKHNEVEAEFHNNIGFFYIKRNELVEAKHEFEKALEQKPMLKEALVNLADLMFITGSYEDALRYYQRATKLNPSNGYIYYQLGNCYMKLDDNKLARLAWERSLDLSPNNIALRRQLAKLSTSSHKEGE